MTITDAPHPGRGGWPTPPADRLPPVTAAERATWAAVTIAAIDQGELDHYLLRIHRAIVARMTTGAWLTGGGPDGDRP